jgi:hypothetical protein
LNFGMFSNLFFKSYIQKKNNFSNPLMNLSGWPRLHNSFIDVFGCSSYINRFWVFDRFQAENCL